MRNKRMERAGCGVATVALRTNAPKYNRDRPGHNTGRSRQRVAQAWAVIGLRWEAWGTLATGD